MFEYKSRAFATFARPRSFVAMHGRLYICGLLSWAQEERSVLHHVAMHVVYTQHVCVVDAVKT